MSQVDVQLSQRTMGWKILMSLWVLPVVAGFGVLSFIGWIWAGYVAQSRRIWRWARVWTALNLAVVAVAFVAPDKDDGPGFAEPWDTIFPASMFSVWIGGIAVAAFLIGPVLKDRVRYQARLAAAMTHDPTHGHGTPGHDLTAPPLEPIDINSASPETISSCPGVAPDTAEAVVRVRRSKGGFTDLDDLVASVRLPAGQAAALSHWITFGPFDTPSSWQHRGPVDL